MPTEAIHPPIDDQASGQFITLRDKEGSVAILPLGRGRFRVTLHPNNPGEMFLSRISCETSLSPDIIESFLKVSFSRLCDSLARHDDPEYVHAVLRRQLLAYFHVSDFSGKRILDFGCGSGASAFCLAALFPEAEVVGVELDVTSVRLAKEVLAFRRVSNLQFHVSPDANSLAAGIGEFDFVMLSAVYEHLLPEERRRLMPLIWSKMKDGAVLLVNGTPHRYFPYEHHSTGLWFVNYLPDKMTLLLARRFSKMHQQLNRSRDWRGHLRGGIRGGTEAEICLNLSRAGDGSPVVIQPRGQDRAAYWLSSINPDRHRVLKVGIATIFRITDRLWNTVPSMNIDVVIRKQRKKPSGSVAAILRAEPQRGSERPRGVRERNWLQARRRS